MLLLIASAVLAQPCVRVVRKEASTLTAAEWSMIVSTIQQAQTTPDTEKPELSIWEAAAELHAEIADEIHWTCLFFPWHRAFLANIEQKLKKLNPAFFFPYWDSGRVATQGARSPIWNHIGSYSGNPVRGDIFGSAPLKEGANSRPLMRVGNNLDKMISSTLYSSLLQTHLTTGFPQWSKQMEVYHGNVHIAVGGSNVGQMGTMASPLDPLFYLHHGYYDYLWYIAQNEWQKTNRAQTGNVLANGQACSPATALPLMGKTWADVLDSTSVCVSYAIPPPNTVSQNATSCPPPLPDSWVRMQETGSAQRGLSAEQAKLDALCKNVTDIIKSGGTIAELPKVSEADKVKITPKKNGAAALVPYLMFAALLY
jgi:hypothetical protein